MIYDLAAYPFLVRRGDLFYFLTFEWATEKDGEVYQQDLIISPNLVQKGTEVIHEALLARAEYFCQRGKLLDKLAIQKNVLCPIHLFADVREKNTNG